MCGDVGTAGGSTAVKRGLLLSKDAPQQAKSRAGKLKKESGGGVAPGEMKENEINGAQRTPTHSARGTKPPCADAASVYGGKASSKTNTPSGRKGRLSLGGRVGVRSSQPSHIISPERDEIAGGNAQSSPGKRKGVRDDGGTHASVSPCRRQEADAPQSDAISSSSRSQSPILCSRGVPGAGRHGMGVKEARNNHGNHTRKVNARPNKAEIVVLEDDSDDELAAQSKMRAGSSKLPKSKPVRPVVLACSRQVHQNIGAALRAMNARSEISLVECSGHRLQIAQFMCGMECGIIRVKYEEISQRKESLRELQEHMKQLGESFSRVYVIVDILHNPAKANTFDRMTTNPEQYIRIMLSISEVKGVQLLTHEGADDGANVIRQIALREAGRDDCMAWLADEEPAGSSNLPESSASRAGLRGEFLEFLKGRKENAALALIAATPRLNVLHALYILSKISCVADLADAIVDGTARNKLPCLTDERFESLTSAFTKPLCTAR